MTLEDEHIITNVAEDNPHELLSRLKKISYMPDVWFTVNNGYASILLAFLQGNKYKIPEDIGVMSFDDTDIAKMVTPKLTVISTNLIEMANESFKLLVKKIKNKSSQSLYIRLLPKITIRDSIKKIDEF